ncbi:MAG TPA: BsuPI-related putative proteinase inhibitor [Candidatus Polarisedimenticolia bacterium]|nr:BsuPI-related putative proteinase inhibitor [Candidatus Polarisedimenticolia bacterium]
MRTDSVLSILLLGTALSAFASAAGAANRSAFDRIDPAGTSSITCPTLQARDLAGADATCPPFCADCNSNGIPDECDIVWRTSFDCNLDVVPDECQIFACEIDDGVHLIELPQQDRVAWFPERGFNTFNVYRGDLDLLKQTGMYTQDPATVFLAARDCHLPAASLNDGIVPGIGQAVYYLLTGNDGLLEGPLGYDGGGAMRSNDNPCPPPPALSVSVRTDKAVYAAGEMVLIEIDVTNLDTTAVMTLHFPSSCQASFRVEELSGIPIYDKPLYCFWVFTQLVLQPGQTATFADEWSQVNDSGQPLNLSGEYVIRGFVLNQVPEPSGITGISVQP